MKNICRCLSAISFFCFFNHSLPLLAAEKVPERTEKKGDLALFYPELQVVPLASKRLEMEAQSEPEGRWTRHLPIQASALATVVAGVTLSGEDHPNFSPEKKDDAKNAALTGTVIGAGWLAVSAYMMWNYTPYQSGQDEISKLPAKTEAETLTRERLAEEKLEKAAALGRRLSWLSVGSNLAASAMMLGSAEKMAKGAAIVSAIGALAPMVFPYHWHWVARQHRDYKKRIYGPVAGVQFLSESQSGVIPAVGFTWSF